MKIVYAPWEDVKALNVESDVLYAISCPAELKNKFHDLVELYLTQYDQVADAFIVVQKMVQTLLSENQIDIHLTHDDLINDLIVEIEWIIEEKPKDSRPYIEAQLLGYAQLMASRMAYLLLNQKSEKLIWLDARDVCITDAEWLDASILYDIGMNKWNETRRDSHMYITAQHVGCTIDNENTMTSSSSSWDWLTSVQ